MQSVHRNLFGCISLEALGSGVPTCNVTSGVEHKMAEANDRGIRVIVDLVVNHTSDQHC